MLDKPFQSLSLLVKFPKKTDLLGLRVRLFAVHEEASYSLLGPRKERKKIPFKTRTLIVLIVLTLKTKSPVTVTIVTI